MNGQYAHNIDAKGRLFIPTKLRDELGGTLHVTIGQDHCLSVYSDEGWARFNESLKGKSFTEIKRLRMMYAYMTDCVPDAQGRILLPAKLRQYANLEKRWSSSASSTGPRSGTPLFGKNGGRGLQLRRAGEGDGRNGDVSHGI